MIDWSQMVAIPYGVIQRIQQLNGNHVSFLHHHAHVIYHPVILLPHVMVPTFTITVPLFVIH
jgi:hypothetical protein